MLRARKLFPAGSIHLGLGFIIRQPLLHIYFILLASIVILAQ